MRVLMIVQELNETSWLRGFIVGWVRALAKHVETLYVLTLERGEANLPDNVFVQSMGKERGYNRWQELREFYRGVGRVVDQVDVIFSHMTPRYTLLAAVYRKPQMLWFIHPRANLEIRAALILSKWVTTATEDSFPIKSSRVFPLGHGIDTDFYSPASESITFEQIPLILAVGRVTPIKKHHVLLEAAALLRDRKQMLRITVAGGTAAPGDEAYRAELIRRRDELGLTENQFNLVGALQPLELVAMLREAAIATNLTPPGSFDKAALEAMLTGIPIITPNPAFDSLLGEYAGLLRLNMPNHAAEIADRIQTILEIPAGERRKIGLDLRERTAAAHGLDNLMQRLVALMEKG